MTLSPFTVYMRVVLDGTLEVEATDGDEAYEKARETLDKLNKFHDLNGIRIEGSWERKDTEVVAVYQEN